jgi:hypothetical protein
MASGTCAACHGEGCKQCYEGGWCAACGGCGLVCKACGSPTVRTSGTHTDCDACQRGGSQCDACAKSYWVDCETCKAGDVEEEALKIAAAAPLPPVLSDEFYRELTAAIENAAADCMKI